MGGVKKLKAVDLLAAVFSPHRDADLHIVVRGPLNLSSCWIYGGPKEEIFPLPQQHSLFPQGKNRGKELSW